MRKLMSRVFFGESLLIFCNIHLFMALSEDEHIIFWETAIPSGMPFISTGDVQPMTVDLEHKAVIDAGAHNRTSFEYKGDENAEISFLISPCKMTEIRWILRYTQKNESGNAATLAEYTGGDYQIYIGKANRGFYWVDIYSSSSIGFMFSIYVTVRPTFVQLLREVKDNNHGRSITFKKNLTEQSISLRWPQWDIKNETVTLYQVILSDKKLIIAACEFEHRYTSVIEHVTTQNTSYKIQYQVVPGEKYYVSIFVIMKNRFLIPYLLGSVNFPKSKPIGLKDGVPTTGNLTSDVNKLTYRYKVRNRQLVESNNEILWYVISCVGSVYVEINHKKDTILSKQTVNRYKMFKIPQSKKGNRYVIKIIDPSFQEGQIEVFATMRPNVFPFPNISNFVVTSSRNLNYLPNRDSYLIAWHPALDVESVLYCIYYMEIDTDDDYEENSNDHCNMRAMVSKMKKLKCRRGKRGNSRKVMTEYLNDLDPSSDYLVYVGARKRSSKRRIWYNPLIIRGKSSIPADA